MTDKIKEMYNNQLNAIVLNKDDLNNLISERNDWGYDALCLRYQELINEIVYLKTFSKEAKEKGHYGDYEYYKQCFYHLYFLLHIKSKSHIYEKHEPHL